MDDALLVRCVQCVGDRRSDAKGFIYRKLLLTVDAIPQCLRPLRAAFRRGMASLMRSRCAAGQQSASMPGRPPTCTSRLILTSPEMERLHWAPDALARPGTRRYYHLHLRRHASDCYACTVGRTMPTED
ncbi:MAG: hypothetical protein IH968_18605 [Gemmatimonadetes bacterium]|nr:hypothetical protein [Gemmatimonadota bacterium]